MYNFSSRVKTHKLLKLFNGCADFDVVYDPRESNLMIDIICGLITSMD